MKKSQKIKYIAISEIALNLGLLRNDVDIWLSKEKPIIKLDHRKRPCVSSNYLEKLSKNKEYVSAKKKSLDSENTLRKRETISRKEFLVKKRLSLLKRYTEYIKDLERIHKSCRGRVNSHHHESSITSAYLLISKAISCLKMGVLCLEHGHWYSGSVIREIDEALHLAHYFVISSSTEKGKVNLHQWFRHNRAPPHYECRQVISSHMAELVGEFDKHDYQNLMNELYQSKSKWVHPTYSSIREVTEFDTTSDISILNIEYGGITFEEKLIELTYFFSSSIWSSFQTFMMCFSQKLPLTKTEDSELLKYNKIFQQPEFHDW